MYGEPIGYVLADARRSLGKSIKEVELDTKIRAKYIEALEQDKFDLLPGSVYAQGFLKTYASYLGIDPEPLVKEYKNSYVNQTTTELPKVATSNLKLKTKERSTWFKAAVFVGIIALFFVVLLVWGAIAQNMARNQSTVDETPKKTTPNTVATPATNEGDSGINQGSSEASSTVEDAGANDRAEPEEVTLKFTGKTSTGSWVKAEVDGELKFEGLISEGVSRVFKGEEEIRVIIGNVPGVEVKLNGKILTEQDLGSSGVAKKTFKARNDNGER